jgi:hypothetical protein
VYILLFIIIILAIKNEKRSCSVGILSMLPVARRNRPLWSRCKGQEGPPLILVHSFIHATGCKAEELVFDLRKEQQNSSLLHRLQSVHSV